MTNLEAASQARAIVRMASGPFVPAQLSASPAKASPLVASMIDAVVSQECVALKDGTGRVVLA